MSRCGYGPVRVLAGAGCLVVLCCSAGCGRAAPVAGPPPSVSFDGALAPVCVDRDPPVVSPVAGPAAGAASAGRFVRPLVLDGGQLRIEPPPVSVQPAVGAGVAECNLRAGRTAQNFGVEAEVRRQGLTFGLGLVTVPDALLSGHTSQGSGVVGSGRPVPPALQPYHQRLAWVAVTAPQLVSNCPTGSAGTVAGGGSSGTGSASPGNPTPRSTSSAAAARPGTPVLPGYQVLVVDAGTGGDGLVYSGSAPALCSSGRTSQVHVDPATELVSLSWQLVNRDPGGYSATISVPLRTCDDAGDAVLADRRQPGLVEVAVTRSITECGAAQPRQVSLHAATITSQLPAQLTHAPVGADDRISVG